MASMEDKLFESLEGHYQHKLDPCNIVEVQKPKIPNFSLINGSDNSLSVWSPITKSYLHLALKEFDHYDEISESDYRRIQKLHGRGSQKQIEEEFYQNKFKDNKPNLSAQEAKIVDFQTHQDKNLRKEVIEKILKRGE